MKTSTEGLTYDTNGSPNDKLQPGPDEQQGNLH